MPFEEKSKTKMFLDKKDLFEKNNKKFVQEKKVLQEKGRNDKQFGVSDNLKHKLQVESLDERDKTQNSTLISNNMTSGEGDSKPHNENKMYAALSGSESGRVSKELLVNSERIETDGSPFINRQDVFENAEGNLFEEKYIFDFPEKDIPADAENKEKRKPDKIVIREMQPAAGGGKHFKTHNTDKGKHVARKKYIPDEQARSKPTETENSKILFANGKKNETSESPFVNNERMESAESPFINRQDVFENAKDNLFAEKYIFWDLPEKDIPADAENRENSKHDKIAIREMQTPAGGGTHFESRYTDKGKLESRVKLSTESKKSSKARTVSEYVGFIDKAKQTFGDEEESEKKANVSGADFVFESIAEHHIVRQLETHDRYKELWVESKQEIKQLKNDSPSRNTSDLQSDKFMTKRDKIQQAESKKRAVRKADNKALRKIATLTAVSKFLNAKRNMQNRLGDMSGESTGDLIKDGSTGLLQTFSDIGKELLAGIGRAVGSVIWKALAGIIGTTALTMTVAVVMITLLFGTVSVIVSGLAADSDAGYSLDVSGDGLVYTSLSGSQETEIVDAVNAAYGGLSWQQEAVIKYALSKVGCEYNQLFHHSMTVDKFDCSSLAYRAYKQAWIDISNRGLYTAADECFKMVATNKITDGSLLPGDLIFYGGSNNGRYLGVYHVAIYVGNVNGADKMVEARGVSWGVVYCDVRSSNVVKVARPYQ